MEIDLSNGIVLDIFISVSLLFEVQFQMYLFFISGEIIYIDPQKLSETGLTVLLANHLFGKLSTSNCFVIDKDIPWRKDDQCFCDNKSCKMTGHFGDTSVGKTSFLTFELLTLIFSS